jgi:hypothetical protein
VKKALFVELEETVDVRCWHPTPRALRHSIYQAGMSIQSVLLDIIFSTRFALIEGCKCGTGRNKSWHGFQNFARAMDTPVTAQDHGYN